MSNPGGKEESREGSCTCSEVQEVDALSATGQDDIELVAGPNLADQGLRQEGLQSHQQPLGHRLLGAGPGTTMRGRRLNLVHHIQGICWGVPRGLGREAERRRSMCCQGQRVASVPSRQFPLTLSSGPRSVSSSFS